RLPPRPCLQAVRPCLVPSPGVSSAQLSREIPIVASNKAPEGGSTCSKGAQSHAVQAAVRAVLALPLLPARDLGRPLDATIVADRIGCSTALRHAPHHHRGNGLPGLGADASGRPGWRRVRTLARGDLSAAARLIGIGVPILALLFGCFYVACIPTPPFTGDLL